MGENKKRKGKHNWMCAAIYGNAYILDNHGMVRDSRDIGTPPSIPCLVRVCQLLQTRAARAIHSLFAWVLQSGTNRNASCFTVIKGSPLLGLKKKIRKIHEKKKNRQKKNTRLCMCVYVFPLSLYTRPIRDSIFRLVRCCCCARRPSVRARLQCLGITSTLFRFIFFSSKVSIWLAKSKLLANNSTSWSATPWLYWSSILVVALRQHQNASYLVYEGITQGNAFFIFAPVPLTSTHGPMPSPRLACPLDLRCSMRPATTRGNSLFFSPNCPLGGDPLDSALLDSPTFLQRATKCTHAN